MNKNNRTVLLFVLLLFISGFIKAEKINKEKALEVAENFFSCELKIKTDKSSLNYFALNCENKDQFTAMHVFSGKNLYIIIAGDDRVFPIIAYSTESSFPTKGEVIALDKWLDNSAKAIAAEAGLKATVSDKIKEAWHFYLSKEKSGSISRNSKSVMPLLQTYWNQDAGYNYYCPPHPAGPDGKCYAGCVATAMSQVMRYYKFPAHGTGNYSYHHQAFGDLIVNFSQSYYDWANMGISITNNDPDTIKRNAIAKLMYDCGISVGMYYTPSGSSSFLERTQYPLYNNYKYRRYITYAERANYNDEIWRNMITDNLDMHYPILYGGQDLSVGGHAWVCDGYQSNNYFHFNWGWGGAGNGFFYLNNLHSGNGNFNYYQDMVYNIVPDTAIYPLCNSKVYTSQTFTFNDGSFTDDYMNNTNCQWLIKPDTGVSIKLEFISFRTEANNDILTVYDGETTSSPILGSFSGTALPPTLYSTTGKMLLVFVSNTTVTDMGWKVKYTTDNVGISESKNDNLLQIYPNPAKKQLNIRNNNSLQGRVRFSIFNTMGMLVLQTDKTVDSGIESECIDISTLKQGVYLLNAESEKGNFYIKFIVE